MLSDPLLLKMIGIQVVTFIAIVLVLRRIMYSSSVGETKRLQQLGEENAKRAQELTKRIQEAEKQSREKIADAEDEVRKLRSEAKEEAERLKKEALNKAKQESERIINQALNSKEKMKEEIQARMQVKMIDLSCDLVQTILSSKNQRVIHEGFLDEILKGIERIKPGTLHVETEKGELITPYEIDKAMRNRITLLISKKVGKKISLQEKIDKEAVAGITIRFGSLVIDGSLSGKLREAAETLRKS